MTTALGCNERFSYSPTCAYVCRLLGFHLLVANHSKPRRSTAQEHRTLIRIQCEQHRGWQSTAALCSTQQYILQVACMNKRSTSYLTFPGTKEKLHRPEQHEPAAATSNWTPAGCTKVCRWPHPLHCASCCKTFMSGHQHI